MSKKWEYVCCLFIWSLGKFIFLSYFYWLVLFLLWIYRSSFCPCFQAVGCIFLQNYRNSSSIGDLNPVVKHLCWKIFSLICFMPFVKGAGCRKAFFNFGMSDWFSVFFMVSVICGKHGETSLFQYYKIIVLFQSGVFIALVFVCLFWRHLELIFV